MVAIRSARLPALQSAHCARGATDPTSASPTGLAFSAGSGSDPHAPIARAATVNAAASTPLERITACESAIPVTWPIWSSSCFARALLRNSRAPLAKARCLRAAAEEPGLGGSSYQSQLSGGESPSRARKHESR